MKHRLLLLALLIASAITASAQYANVRVEQCPSFLKVLQVDYQDSYTVVYLMCHTTNDINYLSISAKAYALTAQGQNLPLEGTLNIPRTTEAQPTAALIEGKNRQHGFVLLFPEMPEGTTFDIIENPKDNTALNIYGITPDVSAPTDCMNFQAFMARYPAKVCGTFMRDGNTILFQKYDGVEISLYAEKNKQYGKYYTVNAYINNQSNHDILFNIDNVRAEGYIVKNGEIVRNVPLEVLSAAEYDKKVARKQKWKSFAHDWDQNMQAANAGKETTTASYSGGSSTSSYASGYGSSYGSSYDGSSRTYSSSNTNASAYGSSTTTGSGSVTVETTNADVAYQARVRADANNAAFSADLAAERQALNEGYIKSNVVPSGERLSGFFNIKYQKVDNLKVEIVIDGETYSFNL